MNPQASHHYHYQDNDYCPGCIAWIMYCEPRFGRYRSGGTEFGFCASQIAPGDFPAQTITEYTVQDSEEDLNNLARFYGIDRSAVTSVDFPVLKESVPYPPSFCTECLEWFDPIPTDY